MDIITNNDISLFIIFFAWRLLNLYKIASGGKSFKNIKETILIISPLIFIINFIIHKIKYTFKKSLIFSLEFSIGISLWIFLHEYLKNKHSGILLYIISSIILSIILTLLNIILSNNNNNNNIILYFVVKLMESLSWNLTSYLNIYKTFENILGLKLSKIIDSIFVALFSTIPNKLYII